MGLSGIRDQAPGSVNLGTTKDHVEAGDVAFTNGPRKIDRVSWSMLIAPCQLLIADNGGANKASMQSQVNRDPTVV